MWSRAERIEKGMRSEKGRTRSQEQMREKMLEVFRHLVTVEDLFLSEYNLA